MKMCIFKKLKANRVNLWHTCYLGVLRGAELESAVLVELPFWEPGNVWSCKVFLLNHIDYVSLNSNPWDGNAPSLGNPRWLP